MASAEVDSPGRCRGPSERSRKGEGRVRMAGDKVKAEFEVNGDMLNLLDRMKDDYKLPSRDKALRCLLDYLAEETDRDRIFKTVRCRRC